MTVCSSAHPASGRLQGDDLLHTFRQIDGLLKKYQGLWRIQPILAVCGVDADDQNETLGSLLRHALAEDLTTAEQLAAAVSDLNLQQIEQIDASAAAQHDFFSSLLPQVTAQTSLNQPLSTSPTAPQTFPFWLTNGIGGRKLAQIRAFIAHTPAMTGTVVEWCAGKGHLGRLLCAASQAPRLETEETSTDYKQPGLNVISLEWQHSLCLNGRQLAEQFSVPQTFQHIDVLSGAGRKALHASNHAIALHACGDLHRTLLEQATEAKLKSIYIAPCCYHLTAQTSYQAMSTTARDAELALSRDELKLAVQGQVTAGERVQSLRQTEVTWRIAYQLLREQYAGADSYLALPSVAKHWFSGRFADFASWACEHHNWSRPDHVDWQALLNQAAQRYLLLKRLDLIRHLFRRPLEMWLVLDRALFLQEQGYATSLHAFCDYQMTPRNLLISARRM